MIKKRLTFCYVSVNICASGGIGTALLRLGQLVGLKIYAIAFECKHAAAVKFGATSIGY
jgi:hypothetical protein